MIKVLAFNGSAKKNGNTSKLLKKVINHIKDAEVEVIHLIDKKLQACLSCSFSEVDCVYPCRIKDDMQEIVEKIKKADALIFASPTYWYCMSGLMKNFIDRLTTCDVAEPPIFDGKVVATIATAYMDGSTQVTLQMTAPLTSMGAIMVPYNDVYTNGGKLWRTEFGVTPDKRLAKNIIQLTKLVKSKQGKWFKS